MQKIHEHVASYLYLITILQIEQTASLLKVLACIRGVPKTATASQISD